jgi:pyruvate dehydrogenase E2 component (dihydrolipoamide acetyltransferase)
MPTEVLVPPLGQTVDVVKLVSWYKNEGDTVQQGEPLFVIETDKATLDVEAPSHGILRHVTAAPGDDVKALSAIALIAAPGEALKVEVEIEAKAEVQSVPHSASTSTLISASTSRRFVSPRARRLAEAEGAPLDAILPTGPEGAIIERDVRAYLTQVKAEAQVETPRRTDLFTSTSASPLASITPVARRMAEEAGLDWRSLAGSGPRGQIVREDVESAVEESKRTGKLESWRISTLPHPPSPTHPLSPFAEQPVDSIPFTGLRGLIAERMVASHSQTAPVTLTAEADASALVELRRQLAADGVQAAYNDLLLYVLARALREHPRLNASLDGETIRVWQHIDIGLATDTDRGLLVPVVRDVGSKGVSQLAAGTADLVMRARAGKCAPEELRGSTFTLTNLGMFGIDAFTPLINQPECAILGVGRIKARPVVVGDQIVARQTVWLSLTFDHRLVDGGPAARFLQRVVQLVERPHLLMA